MRHRRRSRALPPDTEMERDAMYGQHRIAYWIALSTFVVVALSGITAVFLSIFRSTR